MATMRHVRLLSLTSKLILRDSLNLNVTVTENFSRRCLHAASRNYPQSSSIFSKTQSTNLNVFKRCQAPVWSVCGVQRHNSTETSTNISELVPEQDSFIPDPPDLPSYVPVSELPLNALGEPTLQSLGLGSNWPAGLYQQSLEFLHVEGIPWVAAIGIVTVAVRFAMFPLNVMVQRNAARTQNAAPKLSAINDKIFRAQKSGNRLALLKCNEELRETMKTENVHPLKNFAVLFAQAPIFMTVFTGLRGLTNLPVESMKTGGMWWITDITVPDPVFILPVLTAFTLYMTIKLGSDTGVALDETSKRIKQMVQILPLITLVLIAKFPAALCFYWLTSNTYSLFMVLFFKIKPVRKFFKIPERQSIPAPVVEYPGEKPSKRGFVETFQEGVRISEKVLEYESRKQVGAMTLKDKRTKKGMSTSTSSKSSTEKQAKEKGK